MGKLPTTEMYNIGHEKMIASTPHTVVPCVKCHDHKKISPCFHTANIAMKHFGLNSYIIQPQSLQVTHFKLDLPNINKYLSKFKDLSDNGKQSDLN